MADLEFELAVGRKLAMQQMEAFVRDSQKLLDTLVVKPTVKRSGSSGGSTGGLIADPAEIQVQTERLLQLREHGLYRIEQIEQQSGVRLTAQR